MQNITIENDTDIMNFGNEMYQLISELYPLCRSITGNGLRKSLNILTKHIPLEIHEVASGTKVYDWTIPKEWNIRDAFIKDSEGNKVVDFRESNLHVVNYSVPVHLRLSLDELKDHLHSMPEHPDWIPYRTSYYKETWGFCLSHNQLCSMADDEYEVFIDSDLSNGSLTYGEYYLEGENEEEILMFTHICHPSLCNDNLSGVALLTFMVKYLKEKQLKNSYRFLFTPATLGSIAWLYLNEPKTAKIKHGLVAANVGDSGKFVYKKSRRGEALIDRAVTQVLKHADVEYEIQEFSPYGYDERQFCSPGFDLPVGRLTRSPNGCYPQYHTSADNLDFIAPSHLAESFAVYLSVIDLLENDIKYLNKNPMCEPQLGKRGLYRQMGGFKDIEDIQYALLWMLNLSDGKHTLLDISERSGLAFNSIKKAAQSLLDCELLENHQLIDEDI